MKKITNIFLCFLLSAGFTTINAQTRNTLEFDATNAASLVDCGTSASYSPAVFTAEAWVNIYAGEGTIMSNVEWVGGNIGSRGFTIRLSGQKAQFNMGIGEVGPGNNWFEVTANNDLPLNTWTHVAVVYDGSNAEIFYNGISEGSENGSNPILVSQLNFYLGEHPTWPDRRLSGQLSDVRIWNVARTAGEIQASMDAFLSGSETGLVANWKLDEGSGTTAEEQVNLTSATLGAGTTWQLNTSLSIHDELLQKSFSIYPNPSRGVFKVKSAINEIVSYNIYTITGQLVKTGSLSKIVDSIDLSDKSNGLYMLKGTLEGKHFVKRMIVN
ncbi:LamG-like jellyroll fold domain-containing protein [Flavivirga sp. 57AJ16]|uniref:LamG-like jellyroll fold domain-containing protein n=1 Tax=Flavivirga sp. 57AJ16 TaxID=3025307 RepID=UPI002366DCBA|nr:LamG-like jellyroll fold domain-containing protein [Flavivirga sp. 57AJ16]MDD7888152.1 T9SS type A sorting domain-containing protein [Flavivirga sp. 57AJ16]